MMTTPALRALALAATAATLIGVGAALPASASTPASASPTDSATIVPGAAWYDQHGDIAQLHGTGVFRAPDGMFYAVGEDKTDGGSFRGVACYSSPDLASWTREVNALSVDPTEPDLAPADADAVTWRIVERPKVMYNASTETYVMYMHSDAQRYSDSEIGVATSATPCGPYQYQGSIKPLGAASRDMGVFQDDDGSAYLLSSDPGTHKLKVYTLSDDYLTVTSVASQVGNYEAPAMAQHEGTYYLFASNLSGWEANDNVYWTAPSPAGPWTWKGKFAPSGSNTHSSQTSAIVPIRGASGTTFMFVGDRWISPRLYDSPQVWLPMTLSGGTASLAWQDAWTVDVAAGTWQTGTALQRIEAESAANTRQSAGASSCATCSGGSAIVQTSPLLRTYDDHDAGITFAGTGWTRVKGQTWTAQNYRTTETYSSKAGDTATVQFSGTGVRVYGSRHTAAGMVEFSIDGVVQTAFSLREPTGRLSGSSLFEITDLAPGPHTLQVRVPGTKHPLATEARVTIDAVDVLDSRISSRVSSLSIPNVTVPTDGEYTVRVRYAHPDMANRMAQVRVNGETAVPHRFPSTTSAATYQDAALTLPLRAGANTIDIFTTGAQRMPAIDYIEVLAR